MTDIRLSQRSFRDWKVAYLSEPAFKSVFKNLEEAGRYEFGTSFTPRPFFAKQGLEFKEISLPDRTIVIPALEKGADRIIKLKYGEKLVHGIARAKSNSDADEGDARIRSRNYLRRNGLKGPTKLQMFRQIFEGRASAYSDDSLFKAEKSIFGYRLGSLFTAFRCVVAFLFIEPYSIEVDYHTQRK